MFNRIIFAVAFLFVIVACGGGSDERIEQNKEDAASVSDIRTLQDRVRLLEDYVKEIRDQHEMDQVAEVDHHPKPKPNPCNFNLNEFPRTDAFSDVFDRWKECDPMAAEFTTEGRFSGEDSTIANMNGIAWKLRNTSAWSVYSKLPVLQRRQVLEWATPSIATYLVEYLHQDLLHRYLLDIDWDSQVANLNHRYYDQLELSVHEDLREGSIDWPGDRDEVIEVSGYGSASKGDYYARMFWKRRGVVVFKAFKVEVEKVIAENAKS